MNIKNRLARLEGGQASSCEECGQPANFRYKDLFDLERTGGDVDEDDLVENCQECGRKVLFPVYWGGPHNPLGQGPVMLLKLVPR